MAFKVSGLNNQLKDRFNMKFVLLLSLFVVFMATETEGDQVEDAFRFIFDTYDSDNDGKISKEEGRKDMGDVSGFRDYPVST